MIPVGSGSDYLKALFIGFVFTPVFFVIINIVAYESHVFLQFKGMPLSIHSIAEWLLLIPEESRRPISILAATLAWIAGWLLAWSRSRNANITALAVITSYFLYIIYLISFWRIPIVIYIPEGITPILASLSAIYTFELVNKYKPKKTIFDRLRRIGIIFPESWKKPYNLPLSCPVCGATIYSNPKYCWNCHSELESPG